MRILFIGSRLFNDVAEYASAMGVTTILSESNPDAPNLELADSHHIVPRGMEGPLEIALREDVDAVVPLIGVDGPLRDVAWLKDKLETDHGIPVVASGPEAAEISTDKFKTKEFFTRNRIRTPEYSLIDSPADVTEFPAVLKQREGQGGSGVMVAATPSDVRGYLRASDHALMEDYIQGREISVEVLRWNGETLPLVAVDKGETRVDGLHPLKKVKRAPAIIRGFDGMEALERASEITELLGAEGNTDVDMIVSEDGKLYAIEVNTRPSGTRYISEAATGINPMHCLVDMAAGNWKPGKIRRKNHYAVEIPVGNPWDLESIMPEGVSWVLHGPRNHMRLTVRAGDPEMIDLVLKKLGDLRVHRGQVI
jgi:carbamoylphosphate synthase large subunit